MGTITLNPLKNSLSVQGGQITDAPEYNCVGYDSPGAALVALMATFPINFPHTVFPVSKVSGYTPVEVVGPNSAYAYVVNYSIPQGGQHSDPGDGTREDLLSKPPRIESYSQGFYSEQCEVDIYGKPICNSVGDMFDPPGSTDRDWQIAVLSKYKKNFIATDYEELVGTLNNANIILPCLGLVEKRKGRILSIKPAGGYDATLRIPVSLSSGEFVAQDVVTWGSGETEGFAVVVSYADSVLTVFNATNDIPDGTTISTDEEGEGDGVAVSTAAVELPPVKVFWTIEKRRAGFDYPVADKGFNAWGFNNGDENAKLFHLRKSLDGMEPASPVLLKEGAPADPNSYLGGHGDFSSWSIDGSSNRLADRISLEEVTTAIVPHDAPGASEISMTKITFKRINESDWTQIGL